MTVVGGGIAGLATAVALRRRGLSAVVLERRPRPAPGAGGTPTAEGLGLNLPGNAVRALTALGLGPDLARFGEPVRRREYRSHRDRLWFEVDEDAFWGPLERPVCVLRGDLLGALRRLLDEQDVRWGNEVVGLDTTGADATVWLADGTAVTSDLVVGADGVHSSVRRLLDAAAPAPRAAALSSSSWRFVTTDPGVGCWTAWTGPAGTALLIPLTGGRVYGWVATTRPSPTFADVADRLTGFPERVRAALASAAAEPVSPLASPLEEVRPVMWGSGRTVLLGDAAHATPPVWAQGAALAAEDALALADLLAATSDRSRVAAALADARGSRVAHVQRMTDRMSHSAALPAWARELLVPLTGPRTYAATYRPLRDQEGEPARAGGRR